MLAKVPHAVYDGEVPRILDTIPGPLAGGSLRSRSAARSQVKDRQAGDECLAYFVAGLKKMAPLGGQTFQACAAQTAVTPAIALQRAVFLDRDGTLIVNKPYQANPDDLELLPNVPAGLQLLRRAGYRLIVVTNQSGVARGHYDEAAVAAMHDRLSWLLGYHGVLIDAYYFCPHHVDGKISRLARACSCRKPLPGMLERGARDWSIDLTQSWMVGDAWTDVAAGLVVGCRSLLVNQTTSDATEAVPIFSDFLDVAEHIANRERSLVGAVGSGSASRA